MAKGDKSHLRIYCICGQKMKVAESTFGQRAKCVACRRRFRLPRADEIPTGATKFYLKDHRELLRDAAENHAEADEATPTAAEAEALDSAAAPEPGQVVPLDVLEPLKLLCSLERTLTRQADRQGEAAQSPQSDAEDGDTLAKVREARADLNETLRKQLDDVEGESKGAREELVQLALAMRTGDRGFLETRQMLLKLRSRRDRLERRRHNLRGWLACKDPYLAGGYYKYASPDRIPEKGFQVTFPPEPDRPGSLLEEHTDALRDALHLREQAECKLAQTERLATEGRTGITILESSMMEAIADKKRAEAAAEFSRDRLRRLERDHASDMQAIEAQIERARDLLAVQEPDRGRFKVLQRDLRKAGAEIKRAGKAVEGALQAVRAQEVPHVRAGSSAWEAVGAGVFSGAGVDTWIALGASVLLTVCLVVPMMEGLSPLMALRAQSVLPLRALLVGLLISAALVLGAAFVPVRTVRGGLLCGVWAAMCLAAAFWLRKATYDPGPVGQVMRQGGIWMWMLRPGMLLVVLANLGVIAAAWFSLAPLKGLGRFCVPGVMVATGVVAAGVATGFGGYRSPKIYVTQESHPSSTTAGLTYETRITVGNHGNHAFGLALDPDMPAGGCRYLLERQTEDGAWLGSHAPEEIRVAGVVLGEPLSEVVLAPGEEAVFLYLLPPADYRVRVVPSRSPENEESMAFSLAAAPDPSGLRGVPIAPISSRDLARQGTDAAGVAEAAANGAPSRGVVAELRGLASVEGREPRFAFTLTSADGTSTHRDVAMTEELHDGWRVAEYNEDFQTVTLRRGDQLLIARNGQPVDLESLPEP